MEETQDLLGYFDTGLKTAGGIFSTVKGIVKPDTQKAQNVTPAPKGEPAPVAAGGSNKTLWIVGIAIAAIALLFVVFRK